MAQPHFPTAPFEGAHSREDPPVAPVGRQWRGPGQWNVLREGEERGALVGRGFALVTLEREGIEPEVGVTAAVACSP